MRRLTSILFLLVLLFNFIGYRLVIGLIENQQQASINSKLDRSQYKESELISIKTALNLPYYLSTPNFERVYGSVTVNGISYEYVKRRIFRDTLELLCLPNKGRSELESAKNEFVKLALDGQQAPTGKKQAGTIKISLPDFCQEMRTFSALVSVRGNHHYTALPVSHLLAGYAFRQERPPRQC